MSQITGELVPFEGSTQLILPASRLDIVEHGDKVTPDGVYLATDVIQGSYGAAAFGLVIPRPEFPRPTYFIAQEGPAGTYEDRSDEEREQMFPGNPLRQSHFFGTMDGFIMLRTVALPYSVREKLSEDEFLGPALVDKACKEDIITPEDFDEEYKLSVSNSIGWETADLRLEPVENRLLGRLAAIHGEPYVIEREYVSWHSYRAYAQVVGSVAEASHKTVTKLDRLLGMLAGSTVLPVFEDTGAITEPRPIELSPPA